MRMLPSLVLLLVTACCAETDPTENDYVGDAQYICDTLTVCFGLEVPDCAATIASTTAPADVSACAGCYELATCDAIGAPGVPGVCDNACHAALFGYEP